MKTITFQRLIGFLITQRTIEAYGQMTGTNYQFSDSITGATSWCDFQNENDWGECTNTFQNQEEAKYMFQNLFNPNIELIENTYDVQIDTATIPIFNPGVLRGYRVDTKKIVNDVLTKKIKKIIPIRSMDI